ncbi:MAG: RNA polymerase sigma factor, partial [Actinomycetes bacterium]
MVVDRVEEAVVAAFRSEWGPVVATLIRITGDWDVAEECAQDAFALAWKTWPRDGIPRRPGAWLTTAARRRATDRFRRDAVGAAKLQEVGRMAILEPEHLEPDDAEVPDDLLRLIFTCCHPALAFEAQVALTLRTLTGLSSAEIARAFLVPEATLTKRLVRAKQKIRTAGIPYRVPPAHQLAERTAAVLAVLYLLFNEGYAASSGADLVRRSLCDEAVRLGRTLAALMPDEPAAVGLLALLRLHDARRAGRVDAGGALVPLDAQDRTAWDADTIAEGLAVLDAALRRGEPGP